MILIPAVSPWLPNSAKLRWVQALTAVGGWRRESFTVGAVVSMVHVMHTLLACMNLGALLHLAGMPVL